ncbi:BlaR1 peptidase M56 [Chryseobacterium sp. MOF25P]|uniref:M56 family metallopeptidase n=1 Tax=unclassified Chryseobacterium TaxID=2593645 RepID=UPI00080577DE|nr:MULTISPECIES: M56 family metallopeptidase [unclassified Chryseobacterium]OBW43222.1 BlaR1 peptidase M56 [Chryseobacterium sp. MOF25P]OBW46375.1 BlaR1 peptidase M56 [Chryseobacterium sp. BGARF1]
MATIVLKIILCSGILLGLYHVFLVKEKTFTFNRFYLIAALLFSLCIPFATIETKEVAKEIPATVFVESIEQPVEAQIVTQQESFDYTPILLIIYCSIAAFLLFKIVYSVLKIKKLKGIKIKYQNRTVLLLKQNLAPFSFWNTIYLSETYFKDSKIEDSVFLHEEIHIKQKHSVDILFVEVLKAVFWINPFIYFYKKAMVDNHEFIADESVISKNKNIKSYQELILQEILKQQNLPLIHQFNFNNTKKRFIMMNNENSKFAKVKNYLAVPVFAVLAIVFAEKTYAKDTTDNPDLNIFQEKNTPLMTNSNSEKFVKNKEIGIGFNGVAYNEIKKDTISPRKNINAKVSEVKTMSEKPDSKMIQDISTAMEGVAANLVPAEYPGGVNKLRNLIQTSFNSAVMTGNEGLVKSTITFVVGQNGMVRDIKISGENEKINNEIYRVTKLANDNVTWKPATKDGEPVAYQYKIPIAMNFEIYKEAQ